MLTDNQKKISQLLIEQEAILAKLYSVFAEKFPEHNVFWKKLAKEERQHASWVKQIFNAVEKGAVLFDEGKIKINTLGILIKGIEDTISKAQKGEIDVIRAIVITADLERSLIEKNVFSCFKGVSVKSQKIINFLCESTKEHLSETEKLRRELFSS